MKTDRFVVVELSNDDLYAQEFDNYNEARLYVNVCENKAYIIKLENICLDGSPPFKLTLEPHT